MARLNDFLYSIVCLATIGTACFVSSAGCKPKAKPSKAGQAAANPAGLPKTADDAQAGHGQASEAGKPGDRDSKSSATAGDSAETALSQSTVMGAPGSSESPNAANAPSPEAAPAKAIQWSSQHLVVMGKGGPRFFKLNVNVAGQALEAGFGTAMRELAQELSLDFDNPIDWNSLLDKPLVASGWLGNLVPTAEQREQLRGLYDANNNEKVDETEFHAFVTRGLSRTPQLKFNKRRPAPPLAQTESLWGPIDLNDDGELTKAELDQVANSLMRFDFDSDRILSIAEFRSAQESESNAMTSGERTGVYDEPPAQLWALDKPEKMANAITLHYSLANGLARDQCYAWPAGRMEQLDSDKDGVLSESELRQVDEDQLDGVVDLSFTDSLTKSSENLSVHFHTIDRMNEPRWLGHPEGGRVTLDGCIVTFMLSDGIGHPQRDLFVSQLERFEKDTQLRTVLMRALELKEGAFETLESLAAERQKSRLDLAWSWLVAPRQWHVQVTYSASLSPWFELVDHNGDRKLSLKEIELFERGCRTWDRNADGAIQENEMPVSVLLEVKRSEVRGSGLRLGGTDSEKRGANEVSAPTWFTGMDYNSDGELSPSEFLGERSDFEKLDRNRDGIIEAREVTTPQ